MCCWSLDWIFKAKLKLESGNQKIQYGCQAAILKMTSLKIKRLLPIYTNTVLMKFGLDIQSWTKVRVWKQKIQYGHQAAILKVKLLEINRLLPVVTNDMHVKFETGIPKQTWVMLQKPWHLQSPETEKSDMAARQSFWKWHHWKSIGFYPYTQVLCYWSLELIFKAKLKLKSGNQRTQSGFQVAILKVKSLKITRLLLMATMNMHMKFEIEIPKQTWLTLWKPCRLQCTVGRTDGQGRVVKVPDLGLRVTCSSATRGSNTSAATGHLRCRSEQAA